MSQTTITERAETLLQALITRYIADGQPVASKALACSEAINLSSASVRNIMAELESAGFIHSPHTSAGRVPTVQGYRYFVNRLLVAQPERLEIDQIDPILAKQLKPNQNAQHLVASVPALLSGITQLAGVVTVPKCATPTLSQIEFVPLAEKRVLVILVVNGKEVQNQIITTDRAFSETELQGMSAALNEAYTGLPLATIREQILARLQADHQKTRQMIEGVLAVTDNTMASLQKEDCVVSGEHNLLDLAEELGIAHLRTMLAAFNQKQSLLHLLDKCLHAEGIQIFIGEESGYQAFEDCTVITSTYSEGEQPIGVLGVIGPKRMNYKQVIATVDITAKLLTSALSTS